MHTRLLAMAALAASLGIVAAAPAFAARPAQPTRDTQPARNRDLTALLDEHVEWLARIDPVSASQRGDERFNDRLSDVTPDAVARAHEEVVDRLERLDRLNPDRLSEPDLVDAALLRWDLESRVRAHRFREHLMPVSAMNGPQVWLPQMSSRLPFLTPRHYADYAARLEAIPIHIRDHIANMRQAMAEGIVPPRVTVEGADAQCALLASDEFRADPASSPFYAPFRAIDQDSSTAARARRAIESGVIPAFEELGAFLREEYLPACRDTLGITLLAPEGDPQYGREFYEHAIREHTTLTLTADEIHEIGLREVERIKQEMLGVIAASDYPGRNDAQEGELLKAFCDYLRTEPRFYYTSEQELLDGYRLICKLIDPELPRLFGRLPRLTYGVRQIPPIFAPASPTAYYYGGSLKTGVPGYFMANTYALDQRPKFDMIALTLHEAVPGHHLQIALAQELEGLHEYRTLLGFTAYVEGWALYAERLGLEMGALPWPAGRGLYQDPYDDFGRLNFEMWRALRLVVDTGIHAKGWTRQQAIDYMLAHSANAVHDTTTEVDRYIGWPGQALGYKLGELKIRELRARAERELGASFSLREFHDVVLGAGATPLDILDQRVQRWIDREIAEIGQAG
jgi:uncharacterized protein (DUF885 family)